MLWPAGGLTSCRGKSGGMMQYKARKSLTYIVHLWQRTDSTAYNHKTIIDKRALRNT